MAKKIVQEAKIVAENATERVKTLKREIQSLRLELMAGKLKNTSELNKKRKEIARLLTAEQAKKYE